MEKFQTVIFLIRHGQTGELSGESRVADRQRQLTERGRSQAQKMGEYLRAFAPAIIWSSPYDRTIETARIIQRAANIASELRSDQRLAEIYHHQNLATRERGIGKLLRQLVTDCAGQQAVVVSHQVPIEETLKAFGFLVSEIAAPCQMGQGYRIVFAGNIPVECQKIDPSEI